MALPPPGGRLGLQATGPEGTAGTGTRPLYLPAAFSPPPIRAMTAMLLQHDTRSITPTRQEAPQ